MKPICATTAQFPGLSVQMAVDLISQGVSEGIWGALSSEHVQICPQTGGCLSEQLCEQLVVKHPDIQFRLHANARVYHTHLLLDISTVRPDTLFYYELLADRMKRLGSNRFSLHAGFVHECSRERLWDNYHRVQEHMQKTHHDLVVSMEGLYPSRHRGQHVDSWETYEQMLVRGIPFALDLSHLNIVAHHHKAWDQDLVQEMLRSPLCHEIHVSDNNGLADHHQVINTPPVWLDMLTIAADHLDSSTVVFSEGNLLKVKR